MVDYLLGIKVEMNSSLEHLMKELLIDTPCVQDLPEYFNVNARGQIIQIPIELLDRFEVIKSCMSNNWRDKYQPYYLNYNPQMVYNLISFLQGFIIDTTSSEFLALCDEMLINLESKYQDTYCEELKKQYREHINSLDDKKLIEFRKKFKLENSYFNLNIADHICNKLENLFNIKNIENGRKHFLLYHEKYINK